MFDLLRYLFKGTCMLKFCPTVKPGYTYSYYVKIFVHTLWVIINLRIRNSYLLVLFLKIQFNLTHL